ncbi:hypothetical protein C8J57DRAFT_1231268 [Mycena rebaudengoi]|nr:hypothetical protein C8J57DRAFT_1231268 [Mycena rebaudengoi]
MSIGVPLLQERNKMGNGPGINMLRQLEPQRQRNKELSANDPSQIRTGFARMKAPSIPFNACGCTAECANGSSPVEFEPEYIQNRMVPEKLDKKDKEKTTLDHYGPIPDLNWVRPHGGNPYNFNPCGALTSVLMDCSPYYLSPNIFSTRMPREDIDATNILRTNCIIQMDYQVPYAPKHIPRTLRVIPDALRNARWPTAFGIPGKWARGITGRANAYWWLRLLFFELYSCYSDGFSFCCVNARGDRIWIAYLFLGALSTTPFGAACPRRRCGRACPSACGPLDLIMATIIVVPVLLMYILLVGCWADVTLRILAAQPQAHSHRAQPQNTATSYPYNTWNPPPDSTSKFREDKVRRPIEKKK